MNYQRLLHCMDSIAHLIEGALERIQEKKRMTPQARFAFVDKIKFMYDISPGAIGYTLAICLSNEKFKWEKEDLISCLTSLFNSQTAREFPAEKIPARVPKAVNRETEEELHLRYMKEKSQSAMKAIAAMNQAQRNATKQNALNEAKRLCAFYGESADRETFEILYKESFRRFALKDAGFPEFNEWRKGQ